VGSKTAWWLLVGTILTVIAPTSATSQGFYEPNSLCSVHPAVRVGYLFPNSATKFSLSTNSGTALSIQDLMISIDVRGVWTEVSVPVHGFGPFGLALGFSYSFPSNRTSQETYELAPPGRGEREWSSSTQLWNLQAAVTYTMFPRLNALVGFRYDSLLTNLKNPQGAVPSNLFATGDAADLTYSGYLPFLGLQVERALPYGINLKADVLGFPALPGAFEYVETVAHGGARVRGTVQRMTANNEFRSGYFLEGMAELSALVHGVHMGAFVKYSGIYGKTNADVNSFVIVPGLFQTSTLVSYHNKVDVHLERSSWIVGGSASFDFWFP
jgi:hypothetical protein